MCGLRGAMDKQFRLTIKSTDSSDTTLNSRDRSLGERRGKGDWGGRTGITSRGCF